MYNNLKAELTRKGLTSKDLAFEIGMPIYTLYQKLRGKSDFTISETKKIIDALGPNKDGHYFTVEQLFF